MSKNKDDFIMLPTVDFCFKGLMENSKVRKGFIAALLNKNPEEIERTGEMYSDLMEIQILELPKLSKKMKNEAEVVKGMRFFGGKSREEFADMAKTSEYLEEAYRTLEQLSADEVKRLEYEEREKALKDYNTQMSSALARGQRRGEEIGEKRTAKIFKMHLQGKTMEEIAKSCGVTVEKVRQILE